VGSREDFTQFVEAALADLRATGALEWENGTLESFLDGLVAVSDARVIDRDPAVQETASWRLFEAGQARRSRALDPLEVNAAARHLGHLGRLSCHVDERSSW